MQIFLGYIVCNNKVADIPFFIKAIKYEDIDVAKNSGKPFIIIGYELAKDFFKDDFNILEKCINGVYWTFYKREKRVDFETDILSFYEMILKTIDKRIRYKYINLLKLSYNSIKKLINFINSDVKKYIYNSNRKMLYVYYNDTVMGISKELLEYMGIDDDKIIKKISLNKYNIIFNKEYKIPYEIKRIINKEYLTPFFYSLNNG